MPRRESLPTELRTSGTLPARPLGGPSLAARSRLRLVCASCLVLFVELFLIRWLGSNVVYLSYFSNFVLLGSFLGIGIGFLRAHSGLRLFPYAPVALGLLVVFVRIFHVEIDRRGSQLLYFGAFDRTGLPLWATLPVVFVCTAAIMAMIAEEAGRVFAPFAPLEAYRLDIVGSLVGIGAFSVLAFLWLPPVASGLVATGLFALLLPRRLVALPAAVALVVIVVALATEGGPGISWSPYYKIHIVGQKGLYLIDVNGIPHQEISSVAYRRATEPIYFDPYAWRRGRRPGRVLIVGAGTGTDVAIALAHGATSVDAVEIDPRLYQLGREFQPNRAYQDPRVTVHITDGRAFLERTNKRFDLILFALPDSLTVVSGQSALRLESYLFTLEAMRTARDHLQPGGEFAMYNYYREQWLVDRLAGTLATVYGSPPCLDDEGVGRAHFAAVADGGVTCATRWSADGRPVPGPARDDHPFLYLRTNSIPGFYLLTLGLILAASLLGVRVAGGPFRRMLPYADLFLMGAAFLLLETKNVVQFALLFGTTWFVNALVFGGILVVVLAAIEVAHHLPRGNAALSRILYGGLFASLAVAWAIPPHDLLRLAWGARLPAAIALAFAPIFFANLIFAERFRRVGASTVAFGANLLGAVVGGLLEYTAILVGYRSLLVVTAALYAGAFACGRLLTADSTHRQTRSKRHRVGVGSAPR
jgi:SAM-dependent methyltransferase